MKVKPASIVLFVTSVIVLSGFLFFQHQKQEKIKVELAEGLQARAQKTAHDIDLFLYEKIERVKNLSSSSIVLNQLDESNQKLSYLDEKERNNQIEHLNAYWIATTDENDPFIKSYTDNVVAQYLKDVAASNPGEVGEIFITNLYGAIIATTNKLTTLAHANKYWWKAAYNDGKGRVFIDDRGFDQSVKGYVVGVVIPIKKGSDVIGIVKANFNVLGGLSKALWTESADKNTKVMLARSAGLVVLEKGKDPLSSLIPADVVTNIQNSLSTASTDALYFESGSDNNKQYAAAYSSIQISLGSEAVGFGGDYRSADNYKGNEGETWLVLVLHEKNGVD